MLWIYFALVAQFLLQILPIVDGPGHQENGVVMVKPVVANALEEGFSYRNDGDVVFSEANAAVPSHHLLLPRNFHEGHEILIQVHLDEKGNQNLKRLLDFSLHQCPHTALLPLSTNLHSLLVGLEDPRAFPYLFIACDYIIILFLHLRNKPEIGFTDPQDNLTHLPTLEIEFIIFLKLNRILIGMVNIMLRVVVAAFLIALQNCLNLRVFLDFLHLQGTAFFLFFFGNHLFFFLHPQSRLTVGISWFFLFLWVSHRHLSLVTHLHISFEVFFIDTTHQCLYLITIQNECNFHL